MPEGALSELLYGDDLILISETIEGLRHMYLKWKESLESKDSNVNFEKTKVMVSDNITKDGFSKSKFDQCGVASLRVLCAQW